MTRRLPVWRDARRPPLDLELAVSDLGTQGRRICRLIGRAWRDRAGQARHLAEPVEAVNGLKLLLQLGSVVPDLLAASASDLTADPGGRTAPIREPRAVHQDRLPMRRLDAQQARLRRDRLTRLLVTAAGWLTGGHKRRPVRRLCLYEPFSPTS